MPPTRAVRVGQGVDVVGGETPCCVGALGDGGIVYGSDPGRLQITLEVEAPTLQDAADTVLRMTAAATGLLKLTRLQALTTAEFIAEIEHPPAELGGSGHLWVIPSSSHPSGKTSPNPAQRADETNPLRQRHTDRKHQLVSASEDSERGAVAGGRRVAARVRRWLASDLAPGVVLLVATAVALVWANSPLGDSYAVVWGTPLPDPLGLPHDARGWVNDAVMTVFFFAIGLEVKHELTVGVLAHPRAAVVPALAAVGGAVVPAGLFLAITWGGPAAPGWGIPMATDPAFAVGVLALLARRAPASLRLLLLAIATVDDVLAVVVIAVGYTGGVDWVWLTAAGAGCLLVALVRRCGVTAIWPYLPLGAAVWYATLRSGVHPTLAGVALALLTPVGLVADRDLLATLLRRVTPLSAFVAVPVFALANAGVRLDPDATAAAFGTRVTWAVLAALVVGKLVGVAGTIAAVTMSGLGHLPDGITPRHLLGLGLMCGLGFTVSLFVAELAYHDPVLTEHAKIGVLTAAVLCSAAAAVVLTTGQPRDNRPSGS